MPQTQGNALEISLDFQFGPIPAIFSPHAPGLRSAETINYATSRLRSKYCERAFSHAGPAAWNQLPVTIRNAQTQAHFKKLLKTFSFTQFYSCC